MDIKEHDVETPWRDRYVKSLLTHEQHRYAKWICRVRGLLTLNATVRHIVQNTMDADEDYQAFLKGGV